MADVIRKATNKFTKGLVMDFSPENTKNELLTHALNATLLTFNGNELSLQNDMGNARVETAYLPEGYMPVGTCEYGGIIYIVSYNPLENKSQIGCFPSPERNISSDELGETGKKIERSDFQVLDSNGNPTGDLKHTSKHVILKQDNLNPGDKFIIGANHDIYNEKLEDLLVKRDGETEFNLINDPVLSLNVVSIEDSGRIIYLNSDIRHYDELNSYTIGSTQYNDTYRYHILGKIPQGSGQLAQADIDAYRDTLSSGYSVFKSKTSGKLAILAELVTIDSYSITHSVVPRKIVDDSGKESIVEGSFDVIVYTEVTPKITHSNYNTVPKLKYYFLDKSQGYIQVGGDYGNPKTIKLFSESNSYNDEFFKTNLSSIYIPTSSDVSALNTTLENTGKFNFPYPKTYHGKMETYSGSIDGSTESGVYTKFTEGKFHRLKSTQLGLDKNKNFYQNQIRASFYKYNKAEKSYEEWVDESVGQDYVYYIKNEVSVYHDAKRNLLYKNSPLFKLTTEPQIATEEQVKDVLVEKWAEEIKVYYVLVKESEYEEATDIYVKQGDDSYVSVPEKPELYEPIYYFQKISRNMVSLGYTPSQEQITTTVFYYPTTKNYVEATQEDLDIYWNTTDYQESPFKLYYREIKEEYREATESELLNRKELNITIYYSPEYKLVSYETLFDSRIFNDSAEQLFIVVPMDTYMVPSMFTPDPDFNYIEGYPKPQGFYDYPKDDPISLYSVSSFIPDEPDENSNMNSYNELKLANIKIPGVITVNGLDLPFKYDYTLVPCMSYGKLSHLAVSNTVDFSKLHAFNQSDFTTWKYHIDGDQLRLTFGCDVFDTYETYKVDGLVLEFYDLWGFAGSIEITDKKAYSGIFTKIISLNSLKALSNKKVAGSEYVDTYRHNVNILPDETNGGFKYNGKPVSYSGSSGGWTLNKADDDCGTLYSNIVYGVKTYLKRTIKKDSGVSETEFIRKKDFFLYTLPIYNDLYYKVDDFSTVGNPQIDMVLTYKLQDSSTKQPYNGESITDGYTNDDKALLDKYKGGFLEGISTINTTRYYQYEGTSNLYLEVGLKKDYENFNLGYSQDINKFFSCDLKLYANNSEDMHYDVVSTDDSVTTSDAKLNYIINGSPILDSSVNYLGFDYDHTSEISIPVGTLPLYNFINKDIPESSVKINYNFIVGYPITIANIRSTEVPATTVCALCHVNAFGEYNYEDFGVYEEGGKLLSNAMFYNGGTGDTEEFGVCKLVNTSGNMATQCSIVDFVSTEAEVLTTPVKLNTVEPLKKMSSYVGKLTFCQPHAHGMSESNGTNIYGTYPNYFLSPNIGTTLKKGDVEDGTNGLFDWMQDDTRGIVPTENMFNNPLYNLSLNTKNSLKYYSEFVSTLDYKTGRHKVYAYDTGDKFGSWSKDTFPMRVFTGLTADQVVSFNTKLINTMKSVYAYNPDYNSLSVFVGNVSITDNNISFTSNVVSENAKFNFLESESLNDYIYIGPISFKNYLDYLTTYSQDIHNGNINLFDKNSKLLPQVQLQPGLDSCGDKGIPYLVSSLTYNTPTPHEVVDELEFKASSQLIVQHHDGTRSFLSGVPNKKLLYGFNNNRLIQLDVSCYKIDSDGTLTVDLETTDGSANDSILVNSSNLHDLISWNKYTTFNRRLKLGEQWEDVSVNLRIYPYTPYVKYDSKESFFTYGGCYFSVNTDVINDGASTTRYSAKVKSITMKLEGRVLDSSKVTGDMISIQTYDTLNTIFSEDVTDNVVLSRNNYYPLNSSVGDLLVNPSLSNHYIPGVGGPWSFSHEGNSPHFNVTSTSDGLQLFKVTITDIQIEVRKYTKLSDSTSDIIHLNVTPQSYYSKINPSTGTDPYKYVVKTDLYPNACIRGTSITLNDLEYEPNVEEHRLFIRNNCYSNTGGYRNIVYYRGLGDSNASTWTIETSAQDKNHLYLQIGPCFTSANL